MPFGGGPRVCIGNQFALMEAMLVVAAIARRFSVRVAPGHAVVPEPSVTLRFKHGLPVTVSRRKPAARDRAA
jgi:cytochrome P450